MKKKCKLLFLSILALISATLLVFATACGGSESTHDCVYENLPTPTKLTQASSSGSSTTKPHDIVAAMENWKQDRTDELFVKNYYMAVDYILPETSTITLGKNVYVAVCVHSAKLLFNPNQVVLSVDENNVPNSGFYVYNCDERYHGCYGAMEVALKISNDYLTFASQSVLARGGSSFSLPAGYYEVDASCTLSKYIQAGTVTLADAANTSICFNNTVTDAHAEVLALRRLGVTVHADCIENKKPTEHDCVYNPGVETFALDQAQFDAFAEDLQNSVVSMSEEEEVLNVGFAFLAEDIVSSAALTLPEDCYFGICTNGFTFDVPNLKNVYVFDCTPHICDCEMLAEFIPLWQSGIDFCSGLAAESDVQISLPEGSYAMMEDLNGESFLNLLDPNTSYKLCENGYVLKDAELPDASETFVRYDCTTLASDGFYAHDCSLIHGHITPVYITEELLMAIAGDGVLTLPNGATEIALALPMDFETVGTLTIPKGMKLYLCLNGYKISASDEMVSSLVSPFIFNVEFGAELHVCDCSPDKTGVLEAGTLDLLLQLGVDSSSLLYAAPICNLGTLVLDRVTLRGFVGLMNSGRLIARDSIIEGIYVGVFVMEDDAPLHSKQYSNELDGCKVSGALAGFVSSGGATEIRDSEVSGNLFGVMVGLEVIGDDSLGDGTGGSLTLDDVTINITTLIPEGEALVVELLQEFGFVAPVTSDAEITLEGDVIINVDEHLLAPYVTEDNEVQAAVLVDFLLAEGAYFDIADDVTLTDEYRVLILDEIKEDMVLANKDISENFVLMEGLASMTNQDGEFIVVAPDGTSAFNNASITNVEVSFDGYVRLDFYCAFAEQPFLQHEDANVILKVAEEKVKVHPSEMRAIGGGEYVYSVPFYAKDYKDKIFVQFTDGTYTWTGLSSISVEDFLQLVLKEVDLGLEEVQILLDDSMLSEDDRATAEQNKEYLFTIRNAVVSMLNYCGSTAEYFYGVSSPYETEVFGFKTETSVGEETQEEWQTITVGELMGMVTADMLQDYIPSITGSVMPAGVQVQGASLILNSGVFIRFYFTATPEAMQGLSITCNGEPITVKPYRNSKNTYYVEVENLSALQLKTMYTLTLSDGENEVSVSYGALSYMYGVLNNPNADEALVKVAQATYIYAEAIDAAKYFMGAEETAAEVE